MKRFERGFTLIELLVVIAIIGILSSTVLASLNSARQKSRMAAAQAEIDQIRKAALLLESDTLEWPGHKTVDDIESGVSGNEIWDLNDPSAGLVATDGAFPGWNGPYIQQIPLDPWGNPYFFDTDYDIDPGAGQTWGAVIGSFGPNGQGQNLYDSDDIYAVVSSE